MSSEPIELFETKLLKPLKYQRRLVHNGYLYHFQKSCRNFLRWNCSRAYTLKCPAVLKTNKDLLSMEFIDVDHEHVHGDDKVAIYELKMKIKKHQKSSLFTNYTMFKPKNGYTELNFDEEDIPENIDNKLVRFCASMNQIFFVNPLDPDYEHRYIDKREQAIKVKNSNDESSNFENYPNNTFLQRNRRKQKQDTQLCKNVTEENNKDINEKDLKNNITPENFKTSKLYQQSLNSQNRNLTESDTDIKTAKFKERKTNISLTPVMVDLIKKIPSSTIVSISSPELLKSKKRNLTESDTCITKTKSKIKKTKNSSIPNVVNLDVHIPLETTVSIISPKSFDTKQHNLTQSDSSIKMTQSKNMESNEPYTPVLNIPNASRVSQRLINSRKCKLIQNDTSIEITKPKVKKLNKPPTSINLTVDSPPDMTASRISPSMLNSQQSILTQNGRKIKVSESNIIEYYDPSTSASVDLNVNNLTVKTNDCLRKKNIFTQYNKDIKISSTSMSTDLSSNIQTFSSSSRSAITPLNRNLLLNKVITPTFPPNIEVLVVDKNAQLSTLNLSENPNCVSWRSPRSLMVFPKGATDMSSGVDYAILPVAIRRGTKPNMYSPSQYPMVNKLLTQSTSTTIKKNITDTPVNIQRKAPLPDVAYESTQIMNKVNYAETIQPNHSHNNLNKAPNHIKPVPIAITLMPSEIIYDYPDEV